MSINYNRNAGCQSTPCPDAFGCDGSTPLFVIRQHDTRPEFRLGVEDCDGPMDVQGLVVEANMWALASLRTRIEATDTYFRLAGDIGFGQIMINDVIIMDRTRLPEYMLVTGFDEDNKLVRVQRGYKGTTPCAWAKNTTLRIFRVLNAPAETEITTEDITNVDGTVTKGVVTASQLVYRWQPGDTCLPGCYYFEFKMLKMVDLVLFLPGGTWTGPVVRADDGYYYTGTTRTSSSVRLSYDSVDDVYNLSNDHWTGSYHLSSGIYYTGDAHDDGSVYLDRNDETTVTSQSVPSVVPSFVPSVATDFNPQDYGCWLGLDVEWARRLPVEGEGFLIRITPSYTAEI